MLASIEVKILVSANVFKNLIQGTNSLSFYVKLLWKKSTWVLKWNF